MTADSVDLEECDNHFKGVVGSLFAEDNMDVNYFLNPPFRKFSAASSNFQNKYNNPMYDISEFVYPFETSLDLCNIPPKFPDLLPFETLPSPDHDEEIFHTINNSINGFGYIMPTFENSSHSDVDDFCLVSPNSVLPSLPKEENIDPLESMWPEIGSLSDEKLVKIVDSGYLGDNSLTFGLDDILIKKKRRKLTHLDIDHCYSQRLPVEEDYEEEDEEEEEEENFNSFPCSPASLDQLVTSRGLKRARPRRKNVRRKKIKQEIFSEDEEVDVETPCSVPLVVPKIKISVNPTLIPQPSKRGRKPKDKSEGQNGKKTNKNYPVSPKVLQAAIQQQKKKCYITKSGRVTRISNSVETSPSSSTPSSMSNSRSNSDNEENVDKRASHNEAERNRRQELTNLFKNLRLTVPSIAGNEKASKVAILQGGRNRVQTLEASLRRSELEISKLKAELLRKIALVQSLKSGRGCSS